MLDNGEDIARRAAALLDDETQSEFTYDYFRPYIDQEYDELASEMETLGMQFIEGVSVFDLPPGTTDLSPLQGIGQPLQTMKTPKTVKWKPQGQPDTAYQFAAGPVLELREVDPACEWMREWRNANGALQVTPVALATTLKVSFDQLSTTIYDPNQNVIIGTAHILAARVAFYIANVRGMPMAPLLEKKMNKAWAAFASKVVKTRQGNSVVVPKIHRGLRSTVPAGYL